MAAITTIACAIAGAVTTIAAVVRAGACCIVGASADHRTHAQHDQVLGRQRPFQGGFAVQAAFEGFTGIDVACRRDRLDPEQSFEHSQRPLR